MRSRVGVFGLVMLGFSGVWGCGQSPSFGPELASAGGQELVVANGATVAMATYTVSGPNGFLSAGSVPVGNSPDLSIQLSGLPLATGYELYVHALASDGVTTCEATAPFDVTTSVTTVMAHITCAVPTGDLSVTGSLNICPVLDGLDVLPGEAIIGGHAALLATAHDSDNGPSPLTYKWTVNGAPLGNHPQPTLTFTCTTPGVVNIKVSVSDGDVDATCADSLTASVTCTGL